MTEFRFPEKGAAPVGSGDGKCKPFGNRTRFFPTIDPEVAFVLEGIVEHELARSHAAFSDLLRCSIGDNGDFIPLLLQTERQLQARLSAANDGNPSHFPPRLMLSRAGYFARFAYLSPAFFIQGGLRMRPRERRFCQYAYAW